MLSRGLIHHKNTGRHYTVNGLIYVTILPPMKQYIYNLYCSDKSNPYIFRSFKHFLVTQHAYTQFHQKINPDNNHKALSPNLWIYLAFPWDFQYTSSTPKWEFLHMWWRSIYYRKLKNNHA